MNAVFADVSEQERRITQLWRARADERQQVLALCDAIQVAHAEGRSEQVSALLKELDAIVSAALARRQTRSPPR